jgi:hypothetical protein
MYRSIRALLIVDGRIVDDQAETSIASIPEQLGQT